MQSKNWYRRKDITWPVGRETLFREGFPGDSHGKRYHLITKDGVHHHHCILDRSTQYRDEGPQWRTANHEPIDSYNVIAWKEEEN